MRGAEPRNRPLFIHGAVDDYGLTPAQFRVLCAIARRGECFEILANLAKRCRLGEKTVRRALQTLVRCRAVAHQPRRGRPTLYSVRPLAEWACLTAPGAAGKADQGTPGKIDQTEVTPSKYIPIRKSRDYSQGF